MKLQKHGKFTSTLEVTNIDSRGFWILLNGKELYLDYSAFPWFIDASVKQIINVVMESENHLHWPALDVDLTVEMIEHPERFPLKSGCVGQVAEDTAGYTVG